MDRPAAHRDEDLQDALRTVAERRMSLIRRRATCANSLRKLLSQQPAPQRITMKTAASWIGLSERSLHRRLSCERQSYSAIVSEASAIVAKRLLVHAARSVQEAAFAMGFSDASSFQRAFKRWTGTTPTKFRSGG
jgi:AraC-like DNA-binding protein